MAFNVAFLSLFAMLPAPLIYGHLIDTTCDQWQFECGETTNCVLYDADRLRKILMYTTAGIMVVGVKKILFLNSLRISVLILEKNFTGHV